MAFDERLADRVRTVLSSRGGITERKMFGGLAFMVNGSMCVGVMNDDLMVRTGLEAYAESLAQPGARPMDFTGRVSKGMVYVEPSATSKDTDLRSWIDTALAAAATATPQKRSRKSKTKRSK